MRKPSPTADNEFISPRVESERHFTRKPLISVYQRPSAVSSKAQLPNPNGETGRFGFLEETFDG